MATSVADRIGSYILFLMPLPVAHGLLSASVVAALRPADTLNPQWKPLLVGAILGVCPDLDFFLSAIPGLGRGWHHGFTHSFVFAFFLGYLAAWCTGQSGVREVLMYGLAALSHPLLDFLFTEAGGVELFWPFSRQRYRLQIPNPIDYSWRNANAWDSLLDLLKISLTEALVLTPIFLAVLLTRHIIRKREVSA